MSVVQWLVSIVKAKSVLVGLSVFHTGRFGNKQWVVFKSPSCFASSFDCVFLRRNSINRVQWRNGRKDNGTIGAKCSSNGPERRTAGRLESFFFFFLTRQPESKFTRRGEAVSQIVKCHIRIALDLDQLFHLSTPLTAKGDQSW